MFAYDLTFTKIQYLAYKVPPKRGLWVDPEVHVCRVWCTGKIPSQLLARRGRQLHARTCIKPLSIGHASWNTAGVRQTHQGLFMKSHGLEPADPRCDLRHLCFRIWVTWLSRRKNTCRAWGASGHLLRCPPCRLHHARSRGVMWRTRVGV